MAEPINAAPTLDQLECRLRDLELKLGVSLDNSEIHLAHSYNLAGGSDFKSGLNKFVQREIERRPPVSSYSKASDATGASSRFLLHEEFRAIDRILKELDVDPLVGPTMTVGATAPLLFRRMEVLASRESMKTDMVLLARIRDFTSMGRKISVGNEAKVVDCPIVSSAKYNIAVDQDSLIRLDTISFRVANLSKRTAAISHRTDLLLNSYTQVMEALDEKIILAKEQIEDADSARSQLVKL
ncbi:hypothetical protein HJC23_009933 [Cyclotella cryptica]|uniref:Uncharacterized protein n=1 Tax=Cyclotella cryptica TaxID=29204 RepID=A0ABD3NZ81_9STRA|eukprot:CCRYP_018796-RA/>CCRYP_018796-RA protein AED:0.15 eAED:0.08 QI:0/-1/0/1/-1/1/1/0/240